MVRYITCKLLYILFFIFASPILAQTITVEGTITNSTGEPLAFANVIADPNENISIEFAISDDSGKFKLNLTKDKDYKITVSFLGFIPQSLDITATENSIKNFNLVENTELLKEVTLTYTPPVIVKKDTITYRTDAFTTGEERKLRDILKKLPGVEVDREGNVNVRGKKVTKLLVENKEFFTGDSKLAVNNIPADAVDKIEVFDNYNEVEFLKELEENNDVAMNIKLNEDKKKFVFGDIVTGIGVKKRYLINPSLYYYSPKTSINFIGDNNNIGIKSFTIKDYLEFEGGSSSLINDAKSYFSLVNDDISKFIGNQDFTSSRNKFGAFSLTQVINKTADLSTYGIWSDMNNEYKSHLLNDYITINNLKENRTIKGKQNSTFGIGKLKLNFKFGNDSEMKFATYVKSSSNNSDENINTITLESNNVINTNDDVNNFSLKQDIQWHKKFNKKHTASTVFNYNFQSSKPITNWLTDQAILQGLIPLLDEDMFNIFKVKEINSHAVNLVLKHYWVLNRFNHIYTTLGTQLAFDSLETSEYQTLEDNSINDFSNSGFGNRTDLNFNDTFLGLHYKTQLGKATFKPGLFFHSYNWMINQIDESSSNNKILLLPEFTAKFDFSSTKKLSFTYNLKARFPSISQLSNRFTLIHFNSIYQGNELLENELYHFMQFHYYRFSLIKDVFYSFTLGHRFKLNNLKNSTTIQNIDFISTPVLSNFKDKVWTINGSFKKGIGRYKFLVNGSVNLTDYEKPINDELIANSSNTYSFGGGLESRFENLPNFEIGYTKTFSDYNAVNRSRFETDVFSVFIEYDFFNDFIFKLDYNYESYQNKTLESSTVFDVFNTSLFYQKENNPWGFEFTVNNLYDIEFKQRNSFSGILVSDQKTFVLPRIFLLKILYKL